MAKTWRGRCGASKLFLAFAWLMRLKGASADGPACKITTEADLHGGVYPNETINLICDALGKPVDSFLWEKNGAPIRNVSVANTSSTLSISAANSTDEAKYRCTVTKGSNNYTCSVSVKANVFGPPVIKEFPNPSIDFYEDESSDWDCHVTAGWPTPTLEWRVNGKAPEKVQPPFHVVQPHGSKLVLKKYPTTGLKGRQSFACNCTATNTFGTTSRVVDVMMHELPKRVYPVVTTEFRRVFAYEGGNVTLTCEERALCKTKQGYPDILWFHDGKNTVEEQDYDEMDKQCRKFGKYIFRLTKTNMTLKEHGKYRCKVEGEEGADSKTIELVIVHKGFLNLTSERSDVRAQVGGNVTLDCMTTYPDVATLGQFWALNGKFLQTNNSRYTMGDPRQIEERNSTLSNTHNEVKFQRNKVKFSLTIHSVTRRDLGLYECGVNTTLGIEKASIQLLREVPTQKAVDDLSSNSFRSFLIAGGAILGVILVIVLAKYYQVYQARDKVKSRIPPSGPYKYDVFVTFSGKDVQWVEEELVPVLEKNCIKFCIHNRDFELGKPFVDNMIESVYSSRKILAIVSKNYMASNFCRGELELALQRSVEEKADTSLVLLRLDDILKSKLPKLLRGKTFLDYHDTEGRGDWESRLVKTLSKQEVQVSVKQANSFEESLL